MSQRKLSLNIKSCLEIIVIQTLEKRKKIIQMGRFFTYFLISALTEVMISQFLIPQGTLFQILMKVDLICLFINELFNGH